MSCWSTRAISAKPRCARCSPRALIRRATPTATCPTCRPSSPPASTAPKPGRDRARLRRRTSSRPTWAMSSPTPRNRCAGCSTGSTTERSIMRWTTAPTSGRDQHRQGGALGDLRFHRHQRPAARQFQRALFDRPRRIALCRAHLDRRRDPDERRLPEADQAGHPRRLDAEPGLSRPRSSPAMSRPARSSPTLCSPPPGGSRRPKAR